MIFPAIDLMDGGCVRLLKGDFEQRTNYAVDPFEVVAGFAAAGSEWVHIVDLDGAKAGAPQQSELICEIARSTHLDVQTGGGIRTRDHVKALLDGGVRRIIIGSLAIRKPDLVKDWITEFGGDKIILALDIVMDLDGTPRPATSGWTESSGTSLWAVLDDFKGSGLTTILVTDISKDGVLQGSNVGLYETIMKRFPNIDLITSGGAGTIDDIKVLKALRPAGIIIGKALYENRIDLREAVQC